MILSTAVAQSRPAFDFSGIDALRPVYDALAADREPLAADWDRLFSTPGYAALEARERRRAALETAMRLAFMPSRVAGRDSTILAGGFLGRAARHLSGFPAAQDTAAEFRQVLDRSPILEAARRMVGAFLPPGLADTVPPPPVAVVLFLDDGRGYPDIVVADLLRLARQQPDSGFFAHELFHFYRRRPRDRLRSPTPTARRRLPSSLLASPRPFSPLHVTLDDVLLRERPA
ncbi:MAG TPA: DUF5700 domain-containing putative Zn-dependent protease [Gemmatimonadales bacterium]|nr:DUF5700 domain-containing putative Zn-dependent protease [Gemmatimonadales bacterium]